VGSEWAVPCPDVAGWVSAAGLRGGMEVTAYVTSWAADTAAGQSLKEDFIYVFTFSNVSNAGIVITLFIQLFSKLYLWIFLL
jgi:hypothetical protein